MVIIFLIIFLCAIFIGIEFGVHTVTDHLMRNNRLTVTEASYYYSIINLIKIYKDEF